MVWAYIKDYVRKKIANDNTHSMEKLKKYILEAMEELHTPEGLDTLKKYQRLTFRFMDALEKGATGKFLTFLVKRYKSHRSLPPGWEEHLDDHFSKFVKVKTGTENITAESVDAFVGIRDTDCRRHLLKKIAGYSELGAKSNLPAQREADEEDCDILEGDLSEDDKGEQDERESPLNALETWLLQQEDKKNSCDSYEVSGSDSEESGKSDERSDDENPDGKSSYDENDLRDLFYGNWPDDMAINQALSALQLTGPATKKCINQSALTADQLLDAMADRCEDENAEDLILAMVNTSSRRLLSKEQAASEEDMVGGLHFVLVAMHRQRFTVNMKVYELYSHIRCSQHILQNVRVPTQEECQRRQQQTKNRDRGYMSFSQNLKPNWKFEDKGTIGMGWQKDGWRCSYYCMYALLHAGDQPIDIRKKWLELSGEEHLKMMPEGTKCYNILGFLLSDSLEKQHTEKVSNM